MCLYKYTFPHFEYLFLHGWSQYTLSFPKSPSVLTTSPASHFLSAMTKQIHTKNVLFQYKLTWIFHSLTTCSLAYTSYQQWRHNSNIFMNYIPISAVTNPFQFYIRQEWIKFCNFHDVLRSVQLIRNNWNSTIGREFGKWWVLQAGPRPGKVYCNSPERGGRIRVLLMKFINDFCWEKNGI